MVLYNCIGLCLFFPNSISQVVDAINGITGWGTTAWELLKGAERAQSRARAYNMREGSDKKDDVLSARLHAEFREGPLAGAPIDKVELEEAKHIYYEMMGWDSESGLPREMRLHELGIGWVRKRLRELGPQRATISPSPATHGPVADSGGGK
jgi:aldehyde:ferredoxin oxidoreductase